MKIYKPTIPDVLIIDDDPDVHRAAKREIPGDEFNIVPCLDGEAGISAYKKQRPCLV